MLTVSLQEYKDAAACLSSLVLHSLVLLSLVGVSCIIILLQRHCQHDTALETLPCETKCSHVKQGLQ